MLICGDLLEILPTLPEQSIDLIFGSPPYEDARTYGIGFNLKGQNWVDWMVQVYKESLRVCKGLVAFVVQGRTRKYEWSATPAILIADLKRAGICVRNPPIYQRSGIPGSGGPDWLRSDYEWIVCATHGGPLPWSEPTACGQPPKCKPGGAPTHRLVDGTRIRVAPGKGKRVKRGTNHGLNHLCNHEVKGNEVKGNEVVEEQHYIPPKIANPGNVIRCSGGHLGSNIAHENEAPFPEKLAEFFIRSFCPPCGTVLDPFGGSGTTAAVAIKTGRNYICIDIRESQIELMQRRILEASNQQTLFGDMT